MAQLLTASTGLPWQSFRMVSADPAGVYFGTRSGKVFGSADEGEQWAELIDGLPPVISVKAAVV